jgi:spoIIIJ-associated protein
MVREAIGTGDSVLEAQEAACRELGVETHEAEFEVLQMPEKKLFGLFGGCPAKVRAYLAVTPAQAAEDYLRDVLQHMGVVNVDVQAEEREGGVVLNLTGEDVGFVIGRRGETLDALQYLTGLVANHVDNAYYRVTLNIGNYREKREKTLETLARKVAIKAAKTGRKTPLEPMNPYERRIIHTTVQRISGAISWSEGQDLGRHVVIGPDPEAKPAFRPNNNRRDGASRGGYNRGPNRGGYNKGGSRPPRRDAAVGSTAAESAPVASREPKREAPTASLYGRIDAPKKEND